VGRLAGFRTHFLVSIGSCLFVITGLTTAACLWIAAANGLACGAGLYALAPFVALLAIVSLISLKKIQQCPVRNLHFY
jgi:putative Mg2+ transporter-C (MgtC) family protein